MVDTTLEDARGYGTVVCLYQGTQPIHVERVAARMRKPLNLRDASAFISQKYCHVLTRQIPHLYRTYDTFEAEKGLVHKTIAASAARGLAIPAGARILGDPQKNPDGVWLSPMRPARMEDYRRVAAIKHDWNRGDLVLEATLGAGADVYVGRIGPQADVFGGRQRLLPGGAIQIFLPRDQLGFLAARRCWAVA